MQHSLHLCPSFVCLDADVPILHLITFPFPPEWHTVKDNGDILDHAVITNLNKIFAAFIAEYLKL